MNYNVVLSSVDKLSGGSNNKASFQINWPDFLDTKIQKYRVNFAFQSDEDYHVDSAGSYYNLASVVLNTGSRFYTFDTSTKSQSNTIGLISRVGTGTFTSFYSVPSFNLPVIIERPTSNIVTISFYNCHLSNTLLTSTNFTGVATSDMPRWNLILGFQPVEE